MNEIQRETAELVLAILFGLASLQWTAQASGSMVADRSIIQGIQIPLPNNQWQIEVQACLTTLQQGLLQYMLGPSDPKLLYNTTKPNTSEGIALCGRQRVRLGSGGSVTNFSGLGLTFTIALGALIVLASLFLDSIAGLISKFSSTARETHQRWIRDDVLHLQRLAYTAQAQIMAWRGYDMGCVWVGADSKVPKVVGDTLLGPLTEPEEDEVHPRSVGKQYAMLSSHSLDTPLTPHGYNT